MPEPKRKRKPVTTWRAFTQRAVGASLFRPKPPAAAADNSKIEEDPAPSKNLAFEHGK